MKSVSLRFKLISMTVTLVLILGAASFWFSSHFLKQIEEEKLSAFTAHATTIGDGIAAQFYERYGDIQAFAANPNLKSNSQEIIAKTLNHYVALYGIYDLIVITDTQGQIIGTNTLDPRGKNLNQNLIGKSVASAPWFQSTLVGKFTEDKKKGFAGTFVSDFEPQEILKEAYGQLLIANVFSAQIVDDQGKVIGVAANFAGIRWVEDVIADYYEKLKHSGGATTEITMLDKKGTIFIDYDPSQNNGEQAFKHDLNVLFKLNLVEKGVESAKLVVTGQKGSIYSTHARKKIQQAAGFASVDSKKFISSLGWNTLVRTSRDEMLASLIKIEKLFYLIFSILVVVAIGASTVFSNTLAKKLREIAELLSSNTSDVNGVALQVASSSTQLSSATTEQAAALRQTASSIEEVSSMVAKNAENAKRSLEVSNLSQSTSERGKVVINEMVAAIGDISKSNSEIMQEIETSNQQMANIVKIITEIGTKTKVINDIVFQTKLLSFNASVEAARAGEQGKGFAVVAEEVGKLAQMSGNAAKEISDMLDNSIKEVERIVESTKAKVTQLIAVGKEKVDVGNEKAQSCSEILGQVVKNVFDVNQMIEEIAAASQEQAQGVSEITKAISQLDVVTQNNASASEETSAAAEQLKLRADRMRELADSLFITVSGALEKNVSNSSPEEIPSSHQKSNHKKMAA